MNSIISLHGAVPVSYLTVRNHDWSNMNRSSSYNSQTLSSIPQSFNTPQVEPSPS